MRGGPAKAARPRRHPHCGSRGFKYPSSMRLYLSSLGLGDRPDQLLAMAQGRGRAAIIPNALDLLPEAAWFWTRKQTANLTKLGFSVVELDLRAHFGKPDQLAAFLLDIDMIWVNGGNAFVLRRAMKQCGFDALIRHRLEADDMVYAGFSAGSAVCGPTLRGIDQVDDPVQTPTAYDPDIVWEGLGLVPFSIASHYKSDHPESPLTDEAVAFFEAHALPYRALRDGQALVVDGDRQEIVG
jgi:dipeptidase E